MEIKEKVMAYLPMIITVIVLIVLVLTDVFMLFKSKSQLSYYDKFLETNENPLPGVSSIKKDDVQKVFDQVNERTLYSENKNTSGAEDYNFKKDPYKTNYSEAALLAELRKTYDQQNQPAN